MVEGYEETPQSPQDDLFLPTNQVLFEFICVYMINYRMNYPPAPKNGGFQ